MPPPPTRTSRPGSPRAGAGTGSTPRRDGSRRHVTPEGDRPGVRAEAERLVQELGSRVCGIAACVDNREDGAGLLQAAQRERRDRPREAAAAEVGMRADWLELADAASRGRSL